MSEGTCYLGYGWWWTIGRGGIARPMTNLASQMTNAYSVNMPAVFSKSITVKSSLIAPLWDRHIWHTTMSITSNLTPVFRLVSYTYLYLMSLLEKYISAYSYAWPESKRYRPRVLYHYSDVIMGEMASQVTSLTIVYSIVYSGVDQRKHQSSASLAFVRGIHRWPVNPPHKGPVTRNMLPFDDVIMVRFQSNLHLHHDI